MDPHAAMADEYEHELDRRWASGELKNDLVQHLREECEVFVEHQGQLSNRGMSDNTVKWLRKQDELLNDMRRSWLSHSEDGLEWSLVTREHLADVIRQHRRTYQTQLTDDERYERRLRWDLRKARNAAARTFPPGSPRSYHREFVLGYLHTLAGVEVGGYIDGIEGDK